VKAIYLHIGDLVVIGENQYAAKEEGFVEVPAEAIQVTKEGLQINIAIYYDI